MAARGLHRVLEDVQADRTTPGVVLDGGGEEVVLGVASGGVTLDVDLFFDLLLRGHRQEVTRGHPLVVLTDLLQVDVVQGVEKVVVVTGNDRGQVDHVGVAKFF